MAKQRIIPIIYKVDYSQVDKSTQSVKKAEQATDNLNKSIKETGDQGSKSFMSLKNAILATGIISILTTVGKKIFDIGVQAEQTAIAFNTLTGSAERGKKLLAELTKFSIVTPFTPDQVNKAAKALLSFGVEANKIIPTLKIIGDVSSGTGKDLAEMAIIFGQIRSTGRLMGQDLLQLINAGFNPLQVISKKTGESVGELKAQMEKGNITFKMVEQAFIDATSAGGLFFNLMEKQSLSVGGKLSTFAGNIEEVEKAIFAANSGPINDFVDKLVKISESLMLFFKTPEDRQQDIVQGQIDKFTEFSKGFTDMDEALKAFQSTLAQERKQLNDRYEFNLKIINQEITLADMVKGTAQAKEIEKEAAELRNETLRDEIEAFNILNPALEKYVEDTKASTKANDEAAASEANKIKNALKFKPGTTDSGLPAEEKPTMDLPKEFEDQLNKEMMALVLFGDEKDKEKRDQDARELRESIAQKEKLEALEKEHQDNIKALKQAGFEFAIDLIGGLLLSTTDSYSQDTEALRQKYDQQLLLAGDNERARTQIELRRAQDEKKLRDRQLEDERRQQGRRILIETVLNAVKALGLPPIPGANYIAAGRATAYGLLAYGLSRRYSKGSEVGIDGPGSTTSDSIPAMLSKGETVMSYNQTESSKGILKAIKAKKLDDKVLEKLYKSSKIGGDGVGFSDARIVAAIKAQKPDDVIKKGSYLYDVKKTNSGNVKFIRRKYLH